MKVLGAWGGLGGRGCSAGREGRGLYNEVGGILPTIQSPLRPTLYIVSVIFSVFLSKRRYLVITICFQKVHVW